MSGTPVTDSEIAKDSIKKHVPEPAEDKEA